MDNKQTDFFKQLAGDLFRKLLILACGYLLRRGWINAGQSETLTGFETAQFLFGAVFGGAGLCWMYAKQKYNVNVVREARAAPSDTPIEQIKSETLSKHSLISSV